MTEDTHGSAGAGGGGTPAPAPAPAPNPAPAPAPSGTPQGSPTASPAPSPAPAPSPTLGSFKLPDAYKDKPWAAKITSEDDLYKQIDNLNTLVGKKTVAPDLTKLSDAEREEYYKQTRPADATAYQFDKDTPEAIKGALGESLLKNGVSPVQANAVIKAYQDAEKSQLATMYDKDAMMGTLEKSFGADWKQISGNAMNIIKANVPPEVKAMVDGMPNEFLNVTLQVANALVKNYGIKETDAHTGAGAGTQKPGDVTALRKDLRDKISNLSTRPHTADERQALVDQLNNTYKK